MGIFKKKKQDNPSDEALKEQNDVLKDDISKAYDEFIAGGNEPVDKSS
jgi:hypothetical protein